MAKRRRYAIDTEDEGGSENEEEVPLQTLAKETQTLAKETQTLAKETQTLAKEMRTFAKEMDRRFDRLDRVLLPTAPSLLHSPIRRLQLAVPYPPLSEPVHSTWTMVDLSDGAGAPTRCLLGSRHCAIYLYFYTKPNADRKHLFFVSLNKEILRKKVTSVGILKPERGNLIPGSSLEKLEETQMVQGRPEDDIMFINVDDKSVQANDEVPLIPNGRALTNLNGTYHHDKCLVGRSLLSDVSGLYGLTFDITKERLVPAVGNDDPNDSTEFCETGVVRFMMSRCEFGNSGSLLYVASSKASEEMFPVGVLYGLDSAHQSVHRKYLHTRGLVTVCPQKNAFTECPVVERNRLGEGDPIRAIAGYDHTTRKVETAMFTIGYDPQYDAGLNVITLTREDDPNVKVTGVMCMSDVPVLFSQAAGFAHSPDVYAFG